MFLRGDICDYLLQLATNCDCFLYQEQQRTPISKTNQRGDYQSSLLCESEATATSS